MTSVAWSLSLAKPARSDSSTGIGGGGSSERDDYSSMTTDGKQKNANNRQELDKNSIIAAAGSNGVVVVWNAGQFLVSVVSNNNNNNSGSNSNSNSTTAGRSSTTTMGNLKPEATLSLHTRAVNSLAWHPRLPGLLLSASQVSLIIVVLLLSWSSIHFLSNDCYYFHSAHRRYKQPTFFPTLFVFFICRMPQSSYGGAATTVLASNKINLIN